MLKKKWLSVLCLLFCMAFLAGMPVSAAKPKNFATVSNIKISKKTVKPGDTLRYSFTIKAPKITAYKQCKYGVDQVFLVWKSDKKPGQEIHAAFPWDKAGKKHKANLRISGKIKVRKGMSSGKWKLCGIYFNYYEPETEDGNESLYLVHRKGAKYKKLSSNTRAVDLSSTGFKVKTNTPADNAAPVVDNASLALTAASPGNNATFSIRVTDQSPIQSVTCTWENRNRNDEKVDWTRDEKYDDYKMKYNKKTKRYECRVSAPGKEKWKDGGEYCQLHSITVRDIYGHEAQYYTGSALWLDKELKVDGSKMILYYNTDIQKYVEEHPEIREIAALSGI